VRVPGDKSISHRALIVGALARGRSSLTGLNTGRDVAATAAALRLLGVEVSVRSGSAELVGRGLRSLNEPGDVLDCGNSATTLRMLLGVCAGTPGHFVLTGDESLRRRPMARVVDPLRSMGASIGGRSGGDRAPLAVAGRRLRGRDLTTTVPSAQVKSALLLAGLMAEGSTSVREAVVTRDHTERMLAAAGVPMRREGGCIVVQGGSEPAPVDRRIPGDVSAAMVLVVATALGARGPIEIEDVGLNPTRTGAVEILQRMGASITVEPAGEWEGEPVGRLRAEPSALRGVSISPREVPGVIDELPILAVAAAAAEGETVVEGAAELRFKESDRIAATVEALASLGANVVEHEEGFVVRGPWSPGGGVVDARGDHRIAMALMVAAKVAPEPVRVLGAGAADVSFPGFLQLLEGRER
jgi:3-phosphoshikimate 1-carboxyvinyltransferase